MTEPAPTASGRALRGEQPPTLQLLGAFRLTIDHGEIALSPSGERLVALLALQGPMTRSGAAGTLWPLIPEGRALPRLRTCLWRVTSLAADVIRPSRSMVRLDPRVEVDIQVAATHPDAEGAGDLLTYEGDLLPAWDDDWLLVERERLRQIRLHQLDQQATRLVAQGQYGAALAAAYAALGADPFRESALRTIVAVHLAEGNRSEADRVRALLRRLRADGIPADAAPPVPPPPMLPRPPWRP